MRIVVPQGVSPLQCFRARIFKSLSPIDRKHCLQVSCSMNDREADEICRKGPLPLDTFSSSQRPPIAELLSVEQQRVRNDQMHVVTSESSSSSSSAASPASTSSPTSSSSSASDHSHIAEIQSKAYAKGLSTGMRIGRKRGAKDMASAASESLGALGAIIQYVCQCQCQCQF